MTPKKKQNLFWVLTVITAFASVISFFQINSYRADINHLNGFWTVSGIVFGLGCIVSIYYLRKYSIIGGK